MKTLEDAQKCTDYTGKYKPLIVLITLEGKKPLTINENNIKVLKMKLKWILATLLKQLYREGKAQFQDREGEDFLRQKNKSEKGQDGWGGSLLNLRQN